MKLKFILFGLIIIYTGLISPAFAQTEMEIRCMKRIREFSTGMYFPVYTDAIQLTKDTLRFGNSIIILRDTDPESRKIFESGLVFPDLIRGASTMGDKFEFKASNEADTLSVSSVREIHFSGQKPGIKCFSFLLWYKMFSNPALYLFELTNENAGAEIGTGRFIEKAKVTAFGFCSILI